MLPAVMMRRKQSKQTSRELFANKFCITTLNLLPQCMLNSWSRSASPELIILLFLPSGIEAFFFFLNLTVFFLLEDFRISAAD